MSSPKARRTATGVPVDVGNFQNETKAAEVSPHVPAQENEVQRSGVPSRKVSCERSSEKAEPGNIPFPEEGHSDI